MSLYNCSYLFTQCFLTCFFKGKQLSNRGFSCLGEEYLWPEDVLYLAQNVFISFLVFSFRAWRYLVWFVYFCCSGFSACVPDERRGSRLRRGSQRLLFAIDEPRVPVIGGFDLLGVHSPSAALQRLRSSLQRGSAPHVMRPCAHAHAAHCLLEPLATRLHRSTAHSASRLHSAHVCPAWTPQ